MIFFTSDLHFGHENIIKLCGRPFSNAEQMDEALISAWNNRVTNGDTIYIMGDLIFRAARAPEDYLTRLRGKKHLIVGNHDKSWLNKVNTRKYFESVDGIKTIALLAGKTTLCHYPMMAFEGKYLIFGHIHNNKADSYWPLLSKMETALNASIEINGYMPVTFEELLANNKKFRE